jgi:hypothetical protein
MNDPVWRAQIEERLDRVQAAATSLRQSVDALNVPVTQIAELQRENREIRVQAETASQKAEEAERVSVERGRRGGQVLLYGGVGGVVVLLVVTFLTFVSVIVFVQGLIDQQNAARYQSCLTRNQAVTVQARREDILALLPGPSAAERAAHADSARELKKLLVDCAQYKRRP